MHECPRCGYTTKYITNFRKHINAKTICTPTIADVSLDDIKTNLMSTKQANTYICDECQKKYASKETLRVHKKKCKVPTVDIADVIKELKDLKDKIANLETNNQIIINAQQQNNFFNVRPNDFLLENMNYVSDDYIIKCAKKLNNGLIDFIKTIRFNPEHPENMNVKVHRLKNKTLFVFSNNRWEICDAKWTLEEMIVHGAKILHQKILTHFDQEKLLEQDSSESKIQNWLLSLLPRNNEKAIGILSKRLYAMILDNHLLLMEQEDHSIVQTT